MPGSPPTVRGPTTTSAATAPAGCGAEVAGAPVAPVGDGVAAAVGAVARVDDRRVEYFRDAVGNARHGVANDDTVRVHGVEGLRRVEDALRFVEARTRGGEIHDVGRQALAGDFET